MEEQNDPPDQEPSLLHAAPGASEGLTEIFGQLFEWLGRGGRDGLGRGARASRRALERHQVRRDLDRLYQKVGREAICLVEAGEISHPGLEARIPRIREEEMRLSGFDEMSPEEE